MKTKLMLLSAAATASLAILAVANAQQPADAQPSAAAAPATTMPTDTTEAAATKPAPTTQEALTRFSYGVGYQVGSQMKEAEIQLDVGLFTQAAQDALAGTKQKYSDAELEEASNVIRTVVMERMQAKDLASSAKANEESKAFFDANKAKPNVKATASGLQYEIIEAGKDPHPKPTDTVKVNYTGTLLDGTKFDASADHGGPATFPLDGVIKGWTEGLQLIGVGGKAKLYIPSDLAYGPRGRPGIPPNSILIFDVELVEIVSPTTEPAAPTQMP